METVNWQCEGTHNNRSLLLLLCTIVSSCHCFQEKVNLTQRSHTTLGEVTDCRNHWSIMYCLQWMLPILVLPKPLNPALCFHHSVFMILYLLDFFLSRKPCTICSAVFIIALTLLCYSGMSGCVFSSLCADEENHWLQVCNRYIW